MAARLADGLARDATRLLVHTDLHYDNVLTSQRPGQRWVAIDPLDTVAGNGELDRSRQSRGAS